MRTGLGLHVPHFPAAFAPTDLPDLVGWWDPSQTGTITSSGGAVSQLDDLSGNSNHLVQATGTAQPTTGTRTINSLNVLDHTPNDYLTRVFSSAISSDDQTVGIVAQLDGSVNWARLAAMYSGSGSDWNTAGSWLIVRNTPDVRWQVENNSSPRKHYGNTVTDLAVIIAVYVAGAECTFRVNGAAGTTVANGTAGLETASFTLGGSPVDSGVDGRVGEAVYCGSALTGTNLTNLETYLIDKWTP